MRRPEEPTTVLSSSDLADADDRALVAAFLGGRRDAFDAIVTRHQRNVYRLCYRFAGNHEDAADLAQDVFVRAFKSLGRFRHHAALGTWLYRIAVNVCLNRVTVKTPMREPLEGIDMPATAPDPLHSVLKREAASGVRQAIRKLPPKQRATLVLRIYQELSHEEIARVLGGTVGAAKANLFHALRNLRRLMRT